MRHATYSLSYHMLSECRPVLPLRKKLSAGGSQKPQARPFTKMLLYGSLLESMEGYWQVMTQHWIQQTQKTTYKWSQRWRKANCTACPRFTTFWKYGRAANNNMVHRRNLALWTSRWQQWETYSTWKRLSKHHSHSLNMMAQLHINCQNDLLCHQLWLQRTSLENKLKYWMTAESEESTVILSQAIKTVHLNAFQTQKFAVTWMATWILQITAKTIARQTLNLM